jgi:hypothetical protein
VVLRSGRGVERKESSDENLRTGLTISMR